MANVGINVLEVDGLAPPVIAAAPTSVAALAGATERGVPDTPVRVSSPPQFRQRFGGHLAAGYLAYAIDGFFQNGGREAYVSRVVGTGRVAATTTLVDRQAVPAPTLILAAGYRGVEDPGPWGDRLTVTVREDPRGRTQLAGDTPANATSAQIASIDGFRVGGVVRFIDGGGTFYRRITGVDAVTGTLSWAATEAIGPVLASATTRVDGAEFRLQVSFRPVPADEPELVEDWRHLSMESDSADYAVDRLNHPQRGSRYLTAADASAADAPSGLKCPAQVSSRALAGGAAGAPAAADFAGSAALKTGFHAFDTVSAQLLLVPDAHVVAATEGDAGRDSVVRAALDYCAQRGDCMLIGAAPDRGAAIPQPRSEADYTQSVSDYVSSVKGYSARFQGRKVYGALYAGWIRVADPLATGPNRTFYMPADGHVAGLYGRVGRQREVWKAPAGIGAQLRGALAASADFTDREHDDLVRGGWVNGLRPTPGAGIVVAASRTLSTDTRWWFVGTRRLFNLVKSSLKEGLRFVRQEPHTEQLRRTVRLNVVTPFLLGLWRGGAFGSDPPEDVMTVKCDAENNPPDQVALGNFRLEVYFYPSKPAETVLIVVGQQPSGAAASEA